jgi:hypothetical protein
MKPRINGNQSVTLEPVDNAFNGTNSFTGSTSLYNMDLDVYTFKTILTLEILRRRSN